MGSLLSKSEGWVLLLIFAVTMIGLTQFFARRIGGKSTDGFLVANRSIQWWLGSVSIAASWTWAVALMISVQMAYEQGFAGFFWFTVPNIAAVALFVWLAPRIRSQMPNGYSLPEWIDTRLQNKLVNRLYLFVYTYYQVMAIAVQLYAGGSLVSAATGIDTPTLMVMLLVIVLIYSLISGIEASVITDFIQFLTIAFVGVGAAVMVIAANRNPIVLSGVGDIGSANPFDLGIVLTAGIITTIGLISGSIGDQQFWQRAFSIQRKHVKRAFVVAALLFAIIPISLSTLGFVGAANVSAMELPTGFDNSLIGFAIVKHFLPGVIATLFVFALLAGIASTLDSALSASSALYRFHKISSRADTPEVEFSLRACRIAMLTIGVGGLLVGLLVHYIPGFGLKYLWWVLNTVGACVVLPTILSLTWQKLTARGVLIGSLAGIFIGLPVVVYASVIKNDHLLAGAYVGIICTSAIACFSCRNTGSIGDQERSSKGLDG